MASLTNWKNVFSELNKSNHYQEIISYVAQQRAKGKAVYPPENQVFQAFNSTPFDRVKVVILGQDPYHGAHQANGLCFSVNHGIALPPSLKNIYKEIENDINCKMPEHGDLSAWAEQGVLLLNSVLTVEEANPGSHANKGWEQVTNSIIKSLNNSNKSIVYLLWGAYAQKKASLIDKKHIILKAPHPSPLSAYRGFFGCKHFSICNQKLVESGESPIQWQLEQI